ncbi:MAG: hypothetical protein H0W23_05705 [Chloroflexia bacterium]|nr:hypothetical protein [Chloroflexia bacterium]
MFSRPVVLAPGAYRVLVENRIEPGDGETNADVEAFKITKPGMIDTPARENYAHGHAPRVHPSRTGWFEGIGPVAKKS